MTDDCKEFTGRCDPCQQFELASPCSTDVDLTFIGFISEATDLRRLVGSPGEDPQDPAGFIEDDELSAIILRHRQAVRTIAQRRMAEQCRDLNMKIDEQLSALEAADANVEFERETKIQGFKSQLEGQRDLFRRGVETMVEQYVSGQTVLPSEAEEYFDEVEIPMVASPTVSGASYGLIDEPYLPGRILDNERVTVIRNSGDITPAEVVENFDRTIQLYPGEWVVSTRGRYIYASNNSEDIKGAYVWLTTRDRIVEYAKRVEPTGAAVKELEVALEEYEANPVTQSDAAARAAASMIAELCDDPPLLTGDALVADIIIDINNQMIQQARNEVQFSGAGTGISRSTQDEQ